jgi:lipid-A-disaccharide synthase
MKYYIIAGEASGDMHAANLILALKNKDSNALFQAWGGDLMEKAGAKVVKHYRDLAFMGFGEVLRNIGAIYRNFRICKKDILDFSPDVLILVDYPGFNLRIARWAKARHIRVFYYISPQLWAWHSSRAYQIRRDIERMFVILPFEKAFYQKYQYEVDFVGHPLLDVVVADDLQPGNTEITVPAGKKLVALLPGSRKQEITTMLTSMLEIVPQFPDCYFIIAGAPAIMPDFYRDILGKKKLPNLGIIHNNTYALLKKADAALVTSGTATLETALFDVPQVVCYKGSQFSYQIGKRLVNVKYISLVNLILDKPLVKELIQQELTGDNLVSELKYLLSPAGNNVIKTGYQDLRNILGKSGASDKTAEFIWFYLNHQNQ